jgi:catechol 2,3-dioxygenase-like lactoylglutathione lyase family enzyme
MKAIGKRIPLLLACAIAISAMGQKGDVTLTKEVVIHKAWKAMFGDLQNQDIRSIYAEGYFHGRTVPSRITVRRPDRFRNENPAGVLVFDGRRAAWATRAPDEKGNPRGPELIEAKYWRHFEVDIAILFPAFFDHPAEFMGIEKVNGADAYKLHVPLPLGGSVTYFVDSKTFLVTRRLVSWEGDPKEELWENLVDGYVNYDGIRFPDGYSFMGSKGREKGYYKNVRFNVEPEDGLFKIPEELDMPAAGAMAVKRSFFALSVADVARTTAWYVDHLGFRVDKTGRIESSGMEFALISRPDTLIEIVRFATAKSRAAAGLDADKVHELHGIMKIGFEVADIDALYRQAKDKKLRIFELVQAPDLPLRTFGLYDPDNNIVQIFGK